MQYSLGVVHEQMMDHVILHQQECDILGILNEQMMDYVIITSRRVTSSAYSMDRWWTILYFISRSVTSSTYSMNRFRPFTEPCRTPNFNDKIADSLPPARMIGVRSFKKVAQQVQSTTAKLRRLTSSRWSQCKMRPKGLATWVRQRAPDPWPSTCYLRHRQLPFRLSEMDGRLTGRPERDSACRCGSRFLHPRLSR